MLKNPQQKYRDSGLVDAFVERARGAPRPIGGAAHAPAEAGRRLCAGAAGEGGRTRFGAGIDTPTVSASLDAIVPGLGRASAAPASPAETA